MMEGLFIFISVYLLGGCIVSLGQLNMQNHLYDDDHFVWDYIRLTVLWPLVIVGKYK